MKRIAASILVSTFLLQSCLVYKSIPVALSNAVDKGKVKVITNEGETLRFQNIRFASFSESYLGMGEVIMELKEEEISEIYLLNKSGTIGVSILVSVLAIFGLLVIVSFVVLAATGYI